MSTIRGSQMPRGGAGVSLRALAVALLISIILGVLLFWPARAPFRGYQPVLDPVRADEPGAGLATMAPSVAPLKSGSEEAAH